MGGMFVPICGYGPVGYDGLEIREMVSWFRYNAQFFFTSSRLMENKTAPAKVRTGAHETSESEVAKRVKERVA